jgi:molybdopterin synthase catalytic subunit
VVLLFFAAARLSAGSGREEVSGVTVKEVLDAARARHGPAFAAVLDASRVWVNGEPASGDRALHDGDEVAILPPVSGGAGPLDGAAGWRSPLRTVP